MILWVSGTCTYRCFLQVYHASSHGRLEVRFAGAKARRNHCNLPVQFRNVNLWSVSRIRIFPSRIHGQKIPDPGSAWMNLSILAQKLFLSYRTYDPVCSSRIRIRILIFTHPGSWNRNTVYGNGNFLYCGVDVTSRVLRGSMGPTAPTSVPARTWDSATPSPARATAPWAGR